MRRVAIVGVGQIPFKSRYPDRNYQELAFDATKNALADAGVSVKDVDSAVYGIYSDMLMHQMTSVTWCMTTWGCGASQASG